VAHLQSAIGRLFLYQRASIQYGLVTALSKILFIDVFWIHLSLIGTLWSLFVPIIGYKISKTLGTSNRAALLAGVLTASAPMIIGWSIAGVPNSLGFIFFFATIYFLLKWLSSKSTRKYFVLTFLTTAVSLLTHPLTGIATFILVPLAFSVKRYHSLKKTHNKTASWFLAFGFLACIMLLPAASFLMHLIYPTYASFSLQKMLSMDIHQIVLANYATYSTIENLMYSTITFLGIIGIILHGRYGSKKSLRLFMILAFIWIIAEYRIHLYFATRELFGTGRFLAFETFITAPFAVITVEYLVTTAKPAISAALNPNPSKKQGILSRFKFPSKQAIVVILICLGLSALIVEGDLVFFQGLGFRREPYG
ncbi:glycosyltransferase family 39 protein, partial [Candidatus Bathyarchaeota archaeon]|nr:glycosyltransferase family 39 protein [Candidatus Bathyarchaeota archaeon]